MVSLFFFFLYGAATTEIYTLSLHDALPISSSSGIARTVPSVSLGCLPRLRPWPSETRYSEYSTFEKSEPWNWTQSSRAFATGRRLEGDGWGARIRTWEWRIQSPLPYHLATPQNWSGPSIGSLHQS